MAQIYTKSGVVINEDSLITLYNLVRSLDVTTIVKLTQAQYDALYTKDAKTLYLIVNP